MIGTTSFINSVGEYAYDCLTRNGMLLREETSNEVMVIGTEHGSIVCTRDTKIQMDYGIYMYASLLHVGDRLKNQMMNASVITSITFVNEDTDIYKVVDSEKGYLVVNGFFVANDC